MAPNIKHIDNEHRPGLFFYLKVVKIQSQSLNHGFISSDNIWQANFCSPFTFPIHKNSLRVFGKPSLLFTFATVQS